MLLPIRLPHQVRDRLFHYSRYTPVSVSRLVGLGCAFFPASSPECLNDFGTRYSIEAGSAATHRAVLAFGEYWPIGSCLAFRSYMRKTLGIILASLNYNRFSYLYVINNRISQEVTDFHAMFVFVFHK